MLKPIPLLLGTLGGAVLGASLGSLTAGMFADPVEFALAATALGALVGAVYAFAESAGTEARVYDRGVYSR